MAGKLPERIHVNENHVIACKAMCAEYAEHKYILLRRRLNVERIDPSYPRAITRDNLWREIVIAVLSSGTRSEAEDAPLNILRKQNPDILNWQIAKSDQNLLDTCKNAIAAVNREAKGNIRFYNKMPEWISHNMQTFSRDEWWCGILPLLEELRTTRADRRKERFAVHNLQVLKGVGPKQSRLALQLLGITSSEIPIDSRVLTVLHRRIGLVPELEGPAIGREPEYRRLLNAIYELCDRAGVIPVIFDGAAFHAASEFV